MPLPVLPDQGQELSAEPGFRCHICGETSERICPRCTRDACENHLCERCQHCSDCCECE